MFIILEKPQGEAGPISFQVTDEQDHVVWVSAYLSGCLKFLRDQGQLFALIATEGDGIQWTMVDIDQISANHRRIG